MKSQDMLQVMDYRSKIKTLQEEGNGLFRKKDAEKRDFAKAESDRIAEINSRIAVLEVEQDSFIALNHITENDLRTFNPNKPDPGQPPADRKKEKRSAFFKYFREGNINMSREERALVEDATGLYLIPEDIEAEIYRGLPQLNVIRQLARVRPTTRDKVLKRSMTEATVGWGKLETGALINESTPTPSTDYIYVEDITGLVKIGNDELMDSDDVLAGVISDSFSAAIANLEAKAFVIGTGHANGQPDGVTLDPTVISTKTDLATPDTIVPDDVIDIEYKLPAQYKNGASFMWHPSTEAMLRKVKAAANYLWTNPVGITGPAPKTFDGYPIYNSSDMIVPAAANTIGSIVALFGNWRLGYVIVDRMEITIQRLNELYAESGMTGFLVHKRVGGGVVRANAFRALDNAT